MYINTHAHKLFYAPGSHIGHDLFYFLLCLHKSIDSNTKQPIMISSLFCNLPDCRQFKYIPSTELCMIFH